MNGKPTRPALLRPLGLVAVCLFAFLLCFAAGQRGFFMTDQSFVFDGGYRIYCGQVPYRDFLAPWGPVALWLQAAAFKLWGVNYGAYLATAAVQNALGTWLAYRLLRKLFPTSVGLPLAAGAMTAAWYYAPFATPWLEQTGFLFTFIGLNCLVSALLDDAPHQRNVRSQLLLAGCGVCTVLTFLSKQNAGVFMPPVYLAVVMTALAPDWRAMLRACLSYAAGAASASAAFAAWLWIASDPAQFFDSVWVIPASEGGRRLFAEPVKLVSMLLTGKGPELSRMFLFAAALVGLAAWRRQRISGTEGQNRSIALGIAATLCVALPCYQNLFNKTTEQSGNNGMPFIGVVIACAIGLVAQWRQQSSNSLTEQSWLPLRLRFGVLALAAVASILLATGVPIGGAAFAILLAHAANLVEWPWQRGMPVRPLSAPSNWPRALTIAALAVCIFVVAHGSMISWRRQTQHIFGRDCRFPHALPVSRLHQLKWGVPTTGLSGKSITEAELVQLIEYLAQGKRRFFVFPDFSLLYGVVGVESPQPLLWFDSGLTYSAAYDEQLDQRIVAALERNRVDTLVWESATSFEPDEILTDFPVLSAYLHDNFRTVRQIGSFEIRERRSAVARQNAEPLPPGASGTPTRLAR